MELTHPYLKVICFEQMQLRYLKRRRTSTLFSRCFRQHLNICFLNRWIGLGRLIISWLRRSHRLVPRIITPGLKKTVNTELVNSKENGLNRILNAYELIKKTEVVT